MRQSLISNVTITHFLKLLIVFIRIFSKSNRTNRTFLLKNINIDLFLEVVKVIRNQFLRNEKS
jgi:Na+-driven multidrug efflux pump